MKPKQPSLTRRDIVTGVGALAGAGLFARRAAAEAPAAHGAHPGHGASSAKLAAPPGLIAKSTGKTEIFSPPGIRYKPVTTLNGATLPWKMVDGVKVFHLDRRAGDA